MLNRRLPLPANQRHNRWLAIPLLSVVLSGIPVLSTAQVLTLGTNAAVAHPSESKTLQNEVSIETKQLLEQGIQQFNNGQTQQALDTFQRELELRRQAGDRRGELIVLSWLGGINQLFGNYQQALQFFEEALANASDLGDRRIEGESLNNIGNVYYQLGQYQDALPYFEQSLAVAQDIGNRRGQGESFNSMGGIYYRLCQYQDAVAYFERSLEIAQEVGDRPGEGTRLNNIGGIYDRLGQYEEALDYYEQSLVIRQEVGDRQGEVGTRINIGLVYRRWGQYQKALESYQRSLMLAQAIGDRQGEGEALNSIGGVYDILGQHQAALAIYQQSLAIRQEIGDRLGTGLSLNNIGVTYSSLGRYQEASDYYEQSLVIRREIGDRRGEGLMLNNIGGIYRDLEQYEESLDYYKRSLAIAQEIGDRRGESIQLNNIGGIYRSLGQYEESLDHFEQALAILQAIGERQNEGVTLGNLGDVFLATGNAAQAETYLFEAIEALESLRASDLTEDQRITLVENQLDTFQLLQRALATQNKITTALEIAERGRARVFLEELAFRLGRETEAALNQAPIPDVGQIRQIAQEQNATLVEYSIIEDDELYIWVVQPTGDVAFRSISLQDQSLEMSSLVESTRTSLGISRLVSWGEAEPITETDIGALNTRLQVLHELLINPIADLLPADPNESVIFIPQDELFLVPFAALQDGDGTYLIDRHTILTAPSIQVLASTQAQQQLVEQANLQDSLIVGDPTMPLLSLIPGEEPIYLDALPGAEQEALEIANILETEPLLDNTATKSTVVEQMSRSRIIHLATHGILDEFQGLNGGVVLAADGTGEFNDGLLTAAEIAQMELNAEMVVLSACNTGQGRITGDGVIGLSRSLILAGVPSVVVSLWAVPDAPTGELMVEFYRQLEGTDNKAQALRQAMLTIREEYPDPIAWAGFTIIGEVE